MSVILASYNHESFVTAAVESVLSQTEKDLELIVVDDGSSDGTADRVAGIKDSRIRLVRLEENRRCHPRNTGLQLARGAFIAFQNSDDEWHPDKIRNQLQCMQSDPKRVACFTGVELIDRAGAPLPSTWASGAFTTKNRGSALWLRHFFDRGNCLCLPSVMVRREAFRRTGPFKGSLVQFSDLDLWVRLAALGPFHVIGQNLTRMRIVGNENLSAPGNGSENRSADEHVEILARYAAPPLLHFIPAIFDGMVPGELTSDALLKAWLVQYAWATGHLPSHHIFANRLMASLLENDADRQEVTSVFGGRIVREFVRRRGQVSHILNT